MSRSSFALAALATAAIPGLEAVACRAVASTTDFDVAQIVDGDDRRWTIKAPRSVLSGAALEAEVALLKALNSQDYGLGFSVPSPQGFASLIEGGRAMMYPQIPGEPLNAARVGAIAQAVAGAIAAIHSLPTGIIDDAGMPVFSAEMFRERRLAELDEAAATGHVPSALLNRWELACEDVRLWRFIPTFVHGDLTADHVLIDNVQVSGVTEWASAHVGDPAVDLAPLIAEAPTHAMDALLDAYAQARAVDDEFLLARTVLASELALLPWLMHGVRTENSAVLSDAVAMLTELAEITVDTPPIAEIGAEVEPVVEPKVEPVVEPEADVSLEELAEDAGGPSSDPEIEQGATHSASPQLVADGDTEDFGAMDLLHVEAAAEDSSVLDEEAPVRSSAAPGSGAIKLTEDSEDFEELFDGDDMPTIEIPREDL